MANICEFNLRRIFGCATVETFGVKQVLTSATTREEEGVVAGVTA